MSEDQTGSELERELKADASGKHRDAILARLETQAREAKAAMDSGVSPAEFAKLEKQYDGLHAAAEVVAFVWHGYHVA